MYHSYHSHHHSDPLLLEFTNATPEPEFDAPYPSSPGPISHLLELPIELLIMISAYLGASDLFSLLLTAKALPFWLLPTALPLRLPLDRTLLHHAAEKGSPDCMRHILCQEKCLELLNTPDKRGETPLHIAAKREDQRMCEVLLEAGANINARNADRETPIFCAVEAGRAEVVRVLRIRGADLRAVERNKNLTAEQKAVMYGREDVILAIRCEEDAHGERVGYQQLEVATAHGFVEIVGRMIREGKNPFEKGGSKALSVIACWRSGGRIFEELGDGQEPNVAPDLLVMRKRSRWDDLEEEHDTSPFAKQLKLMNNMY